MTTDLHRDRGAGHIVIEITSPLEHTCDHGEDPDRSLGAGEQASELRVLATSDSRVWGYALTPAVAGRGGAGRSLLSIAPFDPQRARRPKCVQCVTWAKFARPARFARWAS